jgi:hypothetical protein
MHRCIPRIQTSCNINVCITCEGLPEFFIEYFKNKNKISGTPILGQIDPLEEISEICAEHKLWFHVDAERGAGLLFLPKKDQLKGIERYNYFTN